MKTYKNRKNKNETAAIVILLIIFILVFLLVFHNCENRKVSDKNGLPGTSENSSVTLEDEETPLGESPGDKAEKKIVFPGFTRKTLKYGESGKLTLQNPKKNSVDFIYSFFYKGEKVYESGLISPGETMKLTVSDIFEEKGFYEIEILITPYDKEGLQKNSFKQDFKFEITE